MRALASSSIPSGMCKPSASTSTAKSSSRATSIFKRLLDIRNRQSLCHHVTMSPRPALIARHHDSCPWLSFCLWKCSALKNLVVALGIWPIPCTRSFDTALQFQRLLGAAKGPEEARRVRGIPGEAKIVRARFVGSLSRTSTALLQNVETNQQTGKAQHLWTYKEVSVENNVISTWCFSAKIASIWSVTYGDTVTRT